MRRQLRRQGWGDGDATFVFMVRNFVGTLCAM